MPKHYIPILKGKAGELKALANLQPKLASAVTPLIEVPPIPTKYPEGQDDPVPAKSIDDHMKLVAKGFCEALADLPRVFIDGEAVELEENLENGSEPSEALFSALRTAKVKFIPVFGLDRYEEYIESVSGAVLKDKRGACLRITEVDLESAGQLKKLVDGL